MHLALEAMINEFTSESEKTARLIAAIPEDKLLWSPHEKSFTLGKLAFHIATIPGSVSGLIQVDSFDVGENKFNAVQPESKAQIVQAVGDSMAEMKKNLSDYDDAKLFGEWQFKNGNEVKFSAPRIVIIRNVLGNHLYHHRGQLTVYLRILNIPLPSVYGPSADENPFA